MLAVSVLGPVELRRDGQRIPVRPGKTTEVLIRLALEAGALVRTDRLIEDLWADDAATTGRNTLQSKVSSLRRALGDAATVNGSSAGYTLEIHPSAVDALEVPRLAATAGEQLASGDAAAARQTCDTALAMFRGEVLVDAGDGDWLVPHRARLEEVRLRLVEDRFAARLELGAAGEVTPELEAVVVEHPLRERLWELLITALYRSGRQADALATYTRVRELLGEELGIDPGPALRLLEQRVLLQDPVLDSTARRSPGRLPPLTSELVGRARELDDLGALVNENRLVTVVGPAGVGKTRVAIEVARNTERRRGSWLVRLESATSESVGPAIASVLGIAGGTEEVVVDHLRGSDALLVLDNCEHVVDAVADLVPRLLDASPTLRVLATSQIALGIDGERVAPLDPLSPAESVALFARRAAEHRRSFVMDDATTKAVDALCGSLDGLPLAIELAAARTKTLSVHEIARRLDDRFAVLRDPTTRRPERQRALATAIGWSYDLLFPDDQLALSALACFAGGASLGATEHVLEALGVPRAAALDAIARLVDRSLVAVDVDETGDVRYRLLDSVRAYGAERLAESGQAPAAGAAHADWFGLVADRVAANVRGAAQANALATARVERANIDTALAWVRTNEPARALDLAVGFGWAWVVLGEGAVGADRVRAALAAAGPDVPPAPRAAAWAVVAWLEAGNRAAGAREAAELGVRAAGDSGDEYALAHAQLARAFVLIQEGGADEALRLLDDSRVRFRALGCAWEEGACCILTAHASLIAGDAPRAASACADAEVLVRPIGDDWGLGHLDATLGQLARAEHRFADAAVHLERAAEAASRLGFATSEGYHLVNLGRVHQQAGNLGAAAVTLERAIDIGHSTAELLVVALAQVRLGRVLRALGESDRAREVLAEADAWYRAAGGGEGAAVAGSLLAAAEAFANAVPDPRAIRALETARAAARDAGSVDGELYVLDALARAGAASGDVATAKAFLDEADALFPAVAHLVDPVDRVDATVARSLIAPVRG
jgi:predicted ATPase/DNA-binding SARP family transcriptional activator